MTTAATSDASPVEGPATSPVLVRDGDRSWALHLVTAALACCAVEVEAGRVLAALGRLEGAGAGESEGGSPDAATPSAGGPSHPGAGRTAVTDVLVVAGTVTHAMAPAVQALHDAVTRRAGRAPRVVAFGACTLSGGPYWDSYSVRAGLEGLVPVDVHVPGCPPRPESLLSALRSLGEDG